MATAVDPKNHPFNPSLEEHRQELLKKFKATVFSYLEVARYELDQLLAAYGKKTFSSALMILAGTMGIAWMSVALAASLAPPWGWPLASLAVGGIFVILSATGFGMSQHFGKKAQEEIKEIGNAALSSKVDHQQLELEAAIKAITKDITKDMLHKARPDVVIDKMVHRSPSAAVISSAIAGAIFGLSQTSSHRSAQK